MYDFDKQQIIEPKRQFTGVWLPKKLLLDERLTAADKILYAEIASFGEKGGWKRADELQQLCGVGRDGLQSACKRLRETGYIVERRMYGRIVRTLAVYSTVVKSHKQDNPVVHKDNTKDNTVYERKRSGRVDDEISKLYYQVIKALSLPVTNHTVIWKKIAEMRKTYPEEISIAYLTFMRDHYKNWQPQYKPQVNNALDVYAKSNQIMNRIKEDVTASEVF